MVPPAKRVSGGSHFCQHFGVLLWKNYLLKQRSPISTLLELFLPLAIAGLLSGLHALFAPVPVALQTHFSPNGDINYVPDFSQAFGTLYLQRKRFAVVPVHASLQPLVDAFNAEMVRRFPSINGSTFGGQGFSTPGLRELYVPGWADSVTSAFVDEADVESWVKSPAYPGNDPYPTDPTVKGRLWGAVVFLSGPPNWAYKLRFNASEITPTVALINTLDRRYAPWTMFKYNFLNPVKDAAPFQDNSGSYDSNDVATRGVPGFLALQLAIDRDIINVSRPMTTASLNDATARVHNALWQTLPNAQTSNVLQNFWDEFRTNELRTNFTPDMLEFSRGAGYFPQDLSLGVFPTFPYVADDFYLAIQYSSPLIFILSFLFSMSRLLHGIVMEKEERLREGLKMNGVSDAALLLSWLFVYEVQFTITSISIAAVLTLGNPLLPGMGFATVFILFWLFTTASVCYVAFVSVLFSSARTASTVGGLMYICSFFPYYAVGLSTSNSGRVGRIAAGILPPTAFAQTLSHMLRLEGSGIRIKLVGAGSNVGLQIGFFSLLDGFLLLAGSALLFTVLALYVDATLPASMRQYGVPLPWYFPCVPKRHWPDVGRALRCSRGARSSGSSSPSEGAKALPGVTNPAYAHDAPAASGGRQGFMEQPDAFLQGIAAAGGTVELRGLVKTFLSASDGTERRAVDGVDLTLYSGQILVLLGHNGAGKTTLINCLTGLIPPSEGTASVFGSELGDDLVTIRRSMGVCPQHDVLWPELTVREHLQIVGAIKGLKTGAAGTCAVTASIDEVGLSAKADAASSTLSGGQKRKLCLAMALLGGSKFVLLDEPTSGMDPYSRRSTWQILQRAREGRVLILTTHFMDEADVLGDRIAIMADGRMHSVGSAIFLKRSFGVGYNLCLVPAVSSAAGVPGAADPRYASDFLKALVQQHIPSAEVSSDLGRELVLRLPLDSSPAFPPLLTSLEALTQPSRSAPLLESFGVGLTTMEDVFMRVASVTRHSSEATGGVVRGGGQGGKVYRTAGFCRQFCAVYTKRALIARRDVRGALFQVLLPVLMVVGGLALLQLGKLTDMPDLRLSPAAISDPASAPSMRARLPAFTFKGTNAWPQDSEHLTAVIRGVHAGLSADGGPSGDAEACSLVSLTASNAIPDVFNVTVFPPLRDCSGQSNCWNPPQWPAKHIADMSKFLIGDYGERMGEDWGGSGGCGGAGAPSIYAALLFSLNSSNSGGALEQQSKVDSFFPALDPGVRASLLLGRDAAPLFNVDESWRRQDGASFLGYVIMANWTAFHAPGYVANRVHNALYRLRLAADAAGAGNPLDPAAMTSAAAALPSGNIAVHNHPLGFTMKEVAATSSMLSFGAAAIITIGYAFIPASQAGFIVKERTSGARHQQLLSGVDGAVYWLTAYVFDVSLFVFPAGITILAAWAFRVTEFAGLDASRLSSFALLLALYGLAVPSYAYLLSFAFTSHHSAQTGVLLTSILSLLLMITSMVLSAVPSTCAIEAKLRFLFKLLPGYALGNGLVNLSFLTLTPITDAACAVHVDPTVDFAALSSVKLDALDLRATGWNIVFLAAEAVIYLLLAFLLDHVQSNPAAMRRVMAFFGGGGRHTRIAAESDAEDSDVRGERERIKKIFDEPAADAVVLGGSGNGAPSSGGATLDSISILLHGLRKVYSPQLLPECSLAKGCGGGGASKSNGLPRGPAVADLSFGVEAGCVFGFLGVNGAGKTTALKILAGDQVPTSGTARLGGYDILSQTARCRRLLGYCPQFDAILDLLTVTEHLELYGRVKGVPELDLPGVISTKLRELDLTPFATKMAGSLSGGNKRKLSVAVAIIGSPSIIFLDEPSSGMDPVAKRSMWRAVRDIVAGEHGCSVILTTHSMEEAEALCTRIGIMVDGRLACLGSPAHLREVYGQGHQLQIRLRAPTAAELAGAVVKCRSTLCALRAKAAAAVGAAEAHDMSRVEAESIVLTLFGPHAPLDGVYVQAKKVSEIKDATEARAVGGKSTAMGGTAPARATAPQLRMTLDNLGAWCAEQELVDGVLRFFVGDVGGAAASLPGAKADATLDKPYLQERHGPSLRVHLPAEAKRPLSALFGIVEAAKLRLGIESYGLSGTSLEQIFCVFAEGGGSSAHATTAGGAEQRGI